MIHAGEMEHAVKHENSYLVVHRVIMLGCLRPGRRHPVLAVVVGQVTEGLVGHDGDLLYPGRPARRHAS